MKIISICSGGLDSTVMYYHLKKEGHTLIPINFNYGSKHNSIERRRAKEIFGKELVEIDIDLSFLQSSLMKNGPSVPHGYYESTNMKSTVVPFRNGIMLSYAIAMAEDMKFDAVALGSHSGDHVIYPDCRPEFTAAIDLAAQTGTYQGVRILSPFGLVAKSDIVKTGQRLSIEKIMGRTWTCYEGDDGTETHCGLCGACNERKGAFAFAHVQDETKYRR